MMKRHYLPKSLKFTFAVVCFMVALEGHPLEVEARLKWFSTASMLPGHDVQRQGHRTPAYDHSADVRVMARQNFGPVRLIVDHSSIWLRGDGVSFGSGGDATLDQTVRSDQNRRWDWTWNIDNGKRHQAFHRFDRFALQWQSSNWNVTVGRDAVSWGSGMVFQPMDLFSPFSPTVVDRDYKAGDDMLLVSRLLKNGHDLQFLHIARRDDDGDVGQRSSSSALKWHGYAGVIELEAAGGLHYDEPVYAVSARVPLGPALARADLVASRDSRGKWVYSGVLNADVSMVVGDRNAYLFAEYFHNGWGVDELPSSTVFLPLDLQQRLLRGEVFNVMKDYVSVGANYEWHPLVSQNVTLISNLHDSSSLLQIGLSYSPGDNQTVQLGWIEPLGRAGDEFGGIPLQGAGTTTGGASRVYLRWVYYL
jgi:hypothetical protein